MSDKRTKTLYVYVINHCIPLNSVVLCSCERCHTNINPFFNIEGSKVITGRIVYLNGTSGFNSK